jgi:hypothetical protein
MLQVHEISFKVYAESKAEADALQTEMMAFVRDKREKGVAVTANKLLRALQTFKNNPFINNYLNN